MARRHKKPSGDPIEAHVEALSHDGRGVARIDGKTVFVDGALPGESVRLVYTRSRRDYDEGRAVEVVRADVDRVVPRCAHFGVCGGCSLQHLSPEAQIAAKQRRLLDNLARIGKVEPAEVFPALTGPVWQYRRKARLGVKYVAKKGRVLIGFREKHSNRLADLERCEVLHPSVGERLPAIAELIDGLSVRSRVAQIEVAVGDEATALVFRHLSPLSGEDEKALVDFGRAHGLHIYLQPGGPDSVAALWPRDSTLSYRLDAYDVELIFQPTDFTQVNAAINAAMVDRALTLLEAGREDRMLDLFCGLGNFTLPLARCAEEVVGVEGEAGLVERARANAAHNGIDNARFYTADLTQDPAGSPWLRGQHYDKVLLDPPRTGAAELLEAIAAVGARRIVYVSCNPATLARDAGVLVSDLKYRLRGAGVMDMFPHTAHVESIALFERA
ncbi:MAG TPA: 23S rRNA (uracil(1939)-C(5))-methyltransferase RlmD [Gammaproteobacteria bacterium]|nr:23S rRNA (uracil(1939)-C(5))-methyltransferase RlmD [Gammaproteobacteria bacterium]